jgi:hypothetical protein
MSQQTSNGPGRAIRTPLVLVAVLGCLSACGNRGGGDDDDNSDEIAPPTEDAEAYCRYVIERCAGRAPECANAFAKGEAIAEGVPDCEDEWAALLACGGIECRQADEQACDLEHELFETCSSEYCAAGLAEHPECDLF